MANERKSGLGRGLSNLLGETIKSEDKPKNTTRIVYREEDFNDDINKEIEGKLVEVPSSNNVSRETIEESHQESKKSENTPHKRNLKEEKKNSNEDERFKELPLNQIVPNPDQPRSNFNREKLKELADSIKENGVIQPILVRKISDQKYQIIAGERRWQASQIAKNLTIPAIISSTEEDESLELALIENIQRDDLNPIEEAWGYKRLMDKLNLTQAQLAQMMSKGRSTISNAIRLLDLPENAQEAMFNNQLTPGHARAILSVPSEEGRQKLIEKINANHLSVRDTESLARLLSLNPAQSKVKKTVPSEYKAISKELKKQLSAPVKIKTTNGKNKIEIAFNDEKDLIRIFDLIVKND